MITSEDRRMVMEMVESGVWKFTVNMRLPDVVAPLETRPLLGRMLNRQKPDNRKHAPCCPANHYHNTRLVFTKCNCGTNVEMDHDNNGRIRSTEEARMKVLTEDEKWVRRW